MTELEAPDVSVVVAAFSGERALARCLESLEPQAGAAAEAVERIVAAPANGAPSSELRARHRDVVFVEVPPPADVFVLRSAGIGRACGRRILLIEDHVTADSGWLAALSDALDDGHPVVGGPVDHGGGSWALYFSEYGLYLPPMARGAVAALSGVNAGYDRGVLESCRATWSSAFRENEVHGALRAAGCELYLEPDATVASHLEMPFAEAARHLFRGGRQFAGWRASRASRSAALLRALAAPAVPGVLLVRLVRQVAARQPRRLRRLLAELPAVLALLSAWSAGEASGYLIPDSPAPETEAP